MATEIAEPDITLASTTESQAELDHATGPEWRKPFVPPVKTEGEGKPGEAASSEKKDDATKTAAASEAAKPGAKEEKGEDDEPLPRGAQKRIDRLTAKLRLAEEEAATLRKGSKPADAAKPAATAANADPEPQVKDYKSWEEWNAAHTRWAVRDENRTLAKQNAEKEAAAAAKETYDSHLTRINEFSSSHDDFEDVVREQPAFTFASEQSNRAFQLAIVEADNGPEIMYHLAKNPEEMAKFSGLSPSKVQIMIGRLSAKLEGASSDGESTDDEAGSSKSAKPAPKSEEPKSKAPTPTTPVRRSTAAPATRLDDPKMSTDDWIRTRNEQERNRRRH